MKNSLKWRLAVMALMLTTAMQQDPGQTGSGGNEKPAVTDQEKQDDPAPEAMSGLGQRRRIKFVDNSIREGYLLKVDGKGILFQSPEKGIPAVQFSWEEISRDDAAALKALFLTFEAAADTAKDLLVPAVKITLKNNQIVEGLVDDNTSTPQHMVLKNKDGLRAIPRDQIETEDKVELRWDRIFTPQEMYTKMMEWIKPTTAEDYEKLAGELVRRGLPDRAFEIFRVVQLLRRPELPEAKVYKDLVVLMKTMEEAALKEIVYQTQAQYLNTDYDRVIALINDLEIELAQQPRYNATLEEVKRIRSEVQMMREMSRDDQIVSEWTRTIESILLTKVLDRNLGFHDAVRYVEGQLMRDAEKSVASRFKIGPEDPTALKIWDRRSPEAHYKVSYDEATWLVTRPELADREAWWANTDNTIRYKYLKGLFVERHMRVIQVFDKNCSRCGGAGTIFASQNMTFITEGCPVCLGLKRQRVVIYR